MNFVHLFFLLIIGIGTVNGVVLQQTHQRVKRIIGGKQAVGHDWPFFVTVSTISRRSRGCGGSLIAQDLVITAAHCVHLSLTHKSNIDTLTVRIYQYEKRTLQLVQKKIKVREIIVHQGWYRNRKMITDDIALLRLTESVDCSTESTKPVILPYQDLTFDMGQLFDQDSGLNISLFKTSSCRVAGFGSVGENMICKAVHNVSGIMYWDLYRSNTTIDCKPIIHGMHECCAFSYVYGAADWFIIPGATETDQCCVHTKNIFGRQQIHEHNIAINQTNDTNIIYGTSFNGQHYSDILMTLDIKGLMSHEECKNKWNNELTKSININTASNSLNPGMICNAELKAGEGICYGDSGGPLVCDHTDGTTRLMGLVSWGTRCAYMDTPGVYTDVVHYLPWIAEQMLLRPEMAKSFFRSHARCASKQTDLATVQGCENPNLTMEMLDICSTD